MIDLIAKEINLNKDKISNYHMIHGFIVANIDEGISEEESQKYQNIIKDLTHYNLRLNYMIELFSHIREEIKIILSKDGNPQYLYCIKMYAKSVEIREYILHEYNTQESFDSRLKWQNMTHKNLYDYLLKKAWDLMELV